MSARIAFVWPLLCALSLTFSAAAKPAVESRGPVTLPNGRTLWVERKPAAPGRPTLIELNGLTYTTREWDAYVAALDKLDPGVGVVRFNMRGMGPTAGRSYEDITLDDQVADTIALIDTLNLPGPLALQGLSYGGALTLKMAAEHPQRFTKFIAMASYLSALPEIHESIEKLITRHRLWRPFDFRTRDELYDHYLRYMVFATYPSAEPSVLRDWPHKLEHIYRMVKGSRHWRAADVIPHLPPGKVHLMFAEADEYVAIKDSRAFAAKLPPGLIASVLYMKNVRHKIPEEAPTLAARWTLRILNDDPALSQGLTWTVDRLKPFSCESIL